MFSSQVWLVMTILHPADTEFKFWQLSHHSFLLVQNPVWEPTLHLVGEWDLDISPKLCFIGIRIILSWRQLRINKCRKNSLTSLYLPKNMAKISICEPWVVWLSCLSAGLKTKESLFLFPVRAHACVAGHVPICGHSRGNHTMMFLSLSFSLPSSLSKNK